MNLTHRLQLPGRKAMRRTAQTAQVIRLPVQRCRSQRWCRSDRSDAAREQKSLRSCSRKSSDGETYRLEEFRSIAFHDGRYIGAEE